MKLYIIAVYKEVCRYFIVFFKYSLYNYYMSIKLMGIEISDDSFEWCVDRAFDLMSVDKVSQVVTINPEMYNVAKDDFNFRKIIDEAEMVVPDGVGIKLALLLKGKRVQRVPGIDFARRILEGCAKTEKRVAIIGSKEEVIVKAVENLKSEIEGLNIVYYHNGYFDDANKIYEELKEVKADLILVALGSPKQEFFIYNAKNILPPCLMIGIGGSLDVWSGTVKRAPEIWQKLGLEWLYRTVTQPERFKRIFPTLPLFLIKALTYKD